MSPKLYYTATSCGAANFISAYIAGLKIESEQVDLGTHKTTSGVDFYTINPKGNVPCIVLDDGTILNENIATLSWIADQAPGKIAPVAGSADHYKVLSLLAHISTELHQTIGCLFNRAHNDGSKAFTKMQIDKKLSFLENNVLVDGQFLVNNTLNIADIYLYVVLSWHAYVDVDISGFPKVVSFIEKVKNDARVSAGLDRIATNPSTVN